MMSGTSAGTRLAADGIELHALLWPDGERKPWLLVHGLASNCRTWERVAGRLNDRGHPVAAVDLRGHGRSDKPDTGYDFATMAGDLGRALDDLGWEKTFLAGQSMGGNLAVHLAASPEHRHRVLGLAGVDGGTIDLVRRWPQWEDCAAALRPPALAGAPRKRVERMVRGAHPDWDDWGVDVTLENLEQLPDGTVQPWLTLERHLRVLRALWEHRPYDDLARVEVPAVMVLAAAGGAEPSDWDRAKREEAATLARAAPQVEVRWLEPADHDVHVEQPVELAGILADALVHT